MPLKPHTLGFFYEIPVSDISATYYTSMKQTLIGILIFATVFLLIKQPAYAEVKLAGSSAMLTQTTQATTPVDMRVQVLKEYLTLRNSPMANNAEDFVREADANDLDWKLVAAIAGLESSFGKHMPHNSYNAWGWGVYGDNVIRFESFADGIAVLSKGLRERYIDRGATTIPAIGRIYASSPTWAERVTFFLNDIEKFSQKNPSRTLSLTI